MYPAVPAGMAAGTAGYEASVSVHARVIVFINHYYGNYISQAIIRAVDIVLYGRFGHKGLDILVRILQKNSGGDT